MSAGRKLMMEQKKLIQLNDLFEKVVSDSASPIERRELNILYQEYIDDGREIGLPMKAPSQYQHATAS
jgi:hypothetical protein